MKKILFVCIGNICRSPMAEHIANKIFEGKCEAQSAGIYPDRSGTSPEVLRVLDEKYQLVVSKRKSNYYRDMPLHEYDLVIALDPMVNNDLKRDKNIKELWFWNVKDPYAHPYEAFVYTSKHLQQLMDDNLAPWLAK